MEDILDPNLAKTPNFKLALLAGGAAGTSVDVILFPLDTLKTRLQSEVGFIKSGGFRGVYSGLFSAAVGSAPTAALFFVTYETVKSVFSYVVPSGRYEAVGHMGGACLGEVSACLVRVPVEVVKQRAQASGKELSSIASFRRTLASEGLAGFYRGFGSTVLREVPFSIIQFPLWELMKSHWAKRSGQPVQAWQSSLCGAASGGFAAALTTPLDVAKTRIMLAERGSSTATGNIPSVLRQVYRERGVAGLFAGVVPRVMWISLGGAIFLGVYDKMRITLTGWTS